MSQQKKWETAIAALMECSTVTEAAAQTRVSRRQLYRWLNDPVFQQELKKAQRQIYGRAMLRLTAMANKAVDVLEDCLEGRKCSKNRFLAACKVLEHSQSAAHQDLQDLTERLEAVLAKYGV